MSARINFFFMLLVLFINTVNCTKESIENHIAAFIKKETAKTPYCTNPEYLSFVNSINGASLMKQKEKRFPLKLLYNDPLSASSDKTRTIYMVIIVNHGFKDIDGTQSVIPFTFVIPSLKNAKYGELGSCEWVQKVHAVYSKSECFFKLVYKQQEYIGVNSWLSSHASVAITPDWGSGKGSTLRALRMVNWLWHSLGVNTALLQDYAKYPCGIQWGWNDVQHQNFRFARIVRLIQLKRDTSIYNAGGYKYAKFKDLNDETMMEHEAGTIEGKRSHLQHMLKDYDVRQLFADYKGNLKIQKLLRKYGFKEMIHKKVIDVLREIYGAKGKGCKQYNYVMDQLYSNGDKSNFVKYLKEWVSITEWMQLDGIQSTEFNAKYYNDIKKSYANDIDTDAMETGAMVEYDDYDDYDQYMDYLEQRLIKQELKLLGIN